MTRQYSSNYYKRMTVGSEMRFSLYESGLYVIRNNNNNACIYTPLQQMQTTASFTLAKRQMCVCLFRCSSEMKLIPYTTERDSCTNFVGNIFVYNQMKSRRTNFTLLNTLPYCYTDGVFHAGSCFLRETFCNRHNPF